MYYFISLIMSVRLDVIMGFLDSCRMFTKSVDRFFSSSDFKGLEKIQNSRSPEKAPGRAGFQDA